MEALSKLLNSDKKVIRTETCWVLSNIASGNIHEVNFFLLSRPESVIPCPIVVSVLVGNSKVANVNSQKGII